VLLTGELPPELKLLAQVALTVWMVAVALLDHRTGRIPNAVTAPVMLGAGALRLIQGFQGEAVRFVLPVVWVLVFALWMLHFIGGGDAKFLMALYAVFPFMDFTGVLALVLLVITVPLLLWDLRGRSPGHVGESLRSRALTGQWLPTEAELQERGRRYAWTFAVPALVYVWVYWRGQ